MPQNIGDILILLVYGRHLAATLEHRAVARGFSNIARFFGTARVPVIWARLSRGMPRILALERVLRARVARGRDLGTSSRLYERNFWNAVFSATMWYRGNLPSLRQDFHRRQIAFEPEPDADPHLGLPEQSRDGVRRILGFFIGQPPVTPFGVPVPPGLREATATGPP